MSIPNPNPNIADGLKTDNLTWSSNKIAEEIAEGISINGYTETILYTGVDLPLSIELTEEYDNFDALRFDCNYGDFDSYCCLPAVATSYIDYIKSLEHDIPLVQLAADKYFSYKIGEDKKTLTYIASTTSNFNIIRIVGIKY